MNDWTEDVDDFWLDLLRLAVDVYEFFEWVGEKITSWIIEIPFCLIGLGIEISILYDRICRFIRKREGSK